jgi:hypothetical protein
LITRDQLQGVSKLNNFGGRPWSPMVLRMHIRAPSASEWSVLDAGILEKILTMYCK